MTEIEGIQPAGAPHGIEPAGEVFSAANPIEPVQTGDVVEISEVGKLAAKIQEIPDVRAELVASVRAEIAAGVYETPERIQIAVERLTDELLGSL